MAIKSKVKDDRELVKTIQEQYHQYRKGGNFHCASCDSLYSYESIAHSGKLVWKMKCPKCSLTVHNFEMHKEDFSSLEFEIIFKKYESKIYNLCLKMNIIEDPQDLLGEMSIRFFLSVMTYKCDSYKCKFSTYMWGNIKRRFEDFERKNARACKSNPVQCKLCGRQTGAITRIHLLNNKIKPKPSFVGHQILHDKIIADYGKNKFVSLDDGTNHDKSVKWQGNNYSKEQTKFIKSHLVDYYKDMFPNDDISMHNVSLFERDPVTELEYSSIIPDKQVKSHIDVQGYYINSCGQVVSADEGQQLIFVPNENDAKTVDICKYYSEILTTFLHQEYIEDQTRKKFSVTRSQKGLGDFLSNVLPLVAYGYNKKQISKISKYSYSEISFWIKRIKESPNVKEYFKIS